jgi:hypothetical protein
VQVFKEVNLLIAMAHIPAVKLVSPQHNSLDRIAIIFIIRTGEKKYMKKWVLIIVLALFVVGNVSVLTWGGIDPGQILSKEDCN